MALHGGIRGQSWHYLANGKSATACGWNWHKLRTTEDWLKVDCQKCLKKKPKAKALDPGR